jgi:hypothetical protein
MATRRSAETTPDLFSAHPEHQRLTEWYGCSFDPDELNLPVINDRIGKLARRRVLGKAGTCQKPRASKLTAHIAQN